MSRTSGPPRYFVDPLYGSIKLTDTEYRVVQSPEFQRLHALPVHGLAVLHSPSMTHTRFAHALGSLQVLQAVLTNSHLRVQRHLHRRSWEDLRLACLVRHTAVLAFHHDLWPLLHHAVEEPVQILRDILSPPPGRPHAVRWKDCRLLTVPPPPNTEFIGGCIRDEQKSRVLGLLSRDDTWYAPLLRGPLNVARLDSIRRDAFFVGTTRSTAADVLQFNFVDRETPPSLPPALEGKGERKVLPLARHTTTFNAVLDVVDDEFRIQRNLRAYHFTRATQALLVRAVAAAIDVELLKPHDLYVLSDAEVLQALTRLEAGSVRGATLSPSPLEVATRLRYRRLPKRCFAIRAGSEEFRAVLEDFKKRRDALSQSGASADPPHEPQEPAQRGTDAERDAASVPVGERQGLPIGPMDGPFLQIMDDRTLGPFLWHLEQHLSNKTNRRVLVAFPYDYSLESGVKLERKPRRLENYADMQLFPRGERLKKPIDVLRNAIEEYKEEYAALGLVFVFAFDVDETGASEVFDECEAIFKVEGEYDPSSKTQFSELSTLQADLEEFIATLRGTSTRLQDDHAKVLAEMCSRKVGYRAVVTLVKCSVNRAYAILAEIYAAQRGIIESAATKGAAKYWVVPDYVTDLTALLEAEKTATQTADEVVRGYVESLWPLHHEETRVLLYICLDSRDVHKLASDQGLEPDRIRAIMSRLMNGLNASQVISFSQERGEYRVSEGVASALFAELERRQSTQRIPSGLQPMGEDRDGGSV